MKKRIRYPDVRNNRVKKTTKPDENTAVTAVPVDSNDSPLAKRRPALEGELRERDLDDPSYRVSRINKPIRTTGHFVLASLLMAPLEEDVLDISSNPKELSPDIEEVINEPSAIVARADPAPIVHEILHFQTYLNSDVDCPAFLNLGANRENKQILMLLHAEGGRFLAQNAREVRYWGNFPSHEKTFIQPYENPQHQFLLTTSPRDHILKSTWVSAVMKDKNNAIIPVHFVTKGTLGSTKNILGYPLRISNLFSDDRFPQHWPQGLGKECIVIKVDTLDQKRLVLREYEKLVTGLSPEAMASVPSFRIFLKNELSPIQAVQNCKQRNIIGFLKPNILPFAQERLKWLRIEKVEIDNLRGQISLEDFQNACDLFFTPVMLSHELALTHFSLSQLTNFCGVLTESRNRFVRVKGKVFKEFQGPLLQNVEVQNFIAVLTDTIVRRTEVINKLNALKDEYVNYSTRLANLLHVEPGLEIEKIEEIIYGRVLDLVDNNPSMQEQFKSGKALITWMLTQNITITNREMLTDELTEHLQSAVSVVTF